MKKFIVIIVLLCGLSINSFSQPEVTNVAASFYNQKHHSIKSHSEQIAFSYKVELQLSKQQYKAIYKALLEHYKSLRTTGWDYSLSTNVAVQPKAESLQDGEQIHNMLKEKLKDVLTVSEYAKYEHFARYPEMMLAKGGPY